MPFAALGGDEVFDLGFDANHIVQNKYFQKLLKIPKLGKLLRYGDVIPSLPSHLIPKRIPFYFQFMPRQSIRQIENLEQLMAFRAEIQQAIYASLEHLKFVRSEKEASK